MVASSEQQSAPVIVIKPATAQAATTNRVRQLSEPTRPT